MVDNDDKYAGDDENLTQVRSIIKQLNEEKPSTERRREVVVRADGTKVVRVTKRRRVMLSAADHKRINRKQFLIVLLSCVVLFAVAAAVFLFRMASMTGSGYVETQLAELKQRWGATSVQVEGAGVEGTSLKLTSIVAEFPEESMIQRVELHGVEASLNMMTFITKVIEGEELRIQRALIQLRPGATMKMPMQEGLDMWRFRRLDCKDFSVYLGDSAESGPMGLTRTQAYMYYPTTARLSSVVVFRGGDLSIKGWSTVHISEGKARLDSTGISDFSLVGTVDSATDVVEQRRTSIVFVGRITEGSDFTGPYAVKSDNMSLADFTGGRFEKFFTARTMPASHGKADIKSTIKLAGAEETAPVFEGEIHLKEISLSSFPALMGITEHIEPAKRRFYNPLSLHRGYVVLSCQDGTMTLSMPDGAILERDLINLRGSISLNSQNELSGNLEFGLPSLLTRLEYPDGQPDPIFAATSEWAWLRTRLKGTGNMPDDDMAEIEARAVIARRDRPERIPFSQIDIENLSRELEGQPAGDTAEPAAPAPQPEENKDRNPFEEKPDRSENPFESRSEDPFAPLSPF